MMTRAVFPNCSQNVIGNRFSDIRSCRPLWLNGEQTESCHQQQQDKHHAIVGDESTQQDASSGFCGR